jgi:hypothetical protein
MGTSLGSVRSSPKHTDYLPHVLRCQRCATYQFASGDALTSDHLARVRPYPEPLPPGAPTGWFRYTRDGDGPPDRFS